MLEFTLALCAAIVVVFFLLLASVSAKRHRRGRSVGVFLAILSAAAAVLFAYVQKSSGNPDAGMELPQLWLPLLIFACFAGAGFLAAIKLGGGK